MKNKDPVFSKEKTVGSAPTPSDRKSRAYVPRDQRRMKLSNNTTYLNIQSYE